MNAKIYKAIKFTIGAKARKLKAGLYPAFFKILQNGIMKITLKNPKKKRVRRISPMLKLAIVVSS